MLSDFSAVRIKRIKDRGNEVKHRGVRVDDLEV